MVRLRRYRYYLFLATVVVFLLYRVVQNNEQWETVSASFPYAVTPSKSKLPPTTKLGANNQPDASFENFSAQDDDLPRRILENTGKEEISKAPDLATAQKSGVDGDERRLDNPPKDPAPIKQPGFLTYDHDEATKAKTAPNVNVPEMKIGHGVKGAGNPPVKADPTAVHWEKTPENFPVLESEIIPLPGGKPRKIPTIQYAFEKESSESRDIREARQAQVKAEMERSWAGYWKYAKGHDELSPVTRKFRDPFCGWAATLVDSLDTLWIMGMEDEFEEALQEVEKIDFTLGQRREIPVFETTIRYLGGLLAAYDVSSGKNGGYNILLEKARELAEILMGAFDTPNRMPILYYNWRPQSASQPKRASTHVSVAELGSLAMEFTRLAQITRENKYYDAVARITDAFYEWQERGTSIPGIFPEHVDVSGCNRTAQNELEAAQSAAELESHDKTQKPNDQVGESNRVKTHELGRSEENTPLNKKDSKTGRLGESILPECVSQGLTTGGWGAEQYSMGGSQDSTYEYFPKQWLLLGGLEPKYKELHLKVSEAVKKWLLYRPMVPDDRDALFSAKVFTRGEPETDAKTEYEVTHLTCFIGGMFGMAGKIFEIPGDVEIGKKLTEGCVWAYESTPTGIMPESAGVLPCLDAQDCHWNITQYEVGLDPLFDSREKQIEQYYEGKARAKAAKEREREREREAKKLTSDSTSSTHQAGKSKALLDEELPGTSHLNHEDVGLQRRAPFTDVRDPEHNEPERHAVITQRELDDSDPAPGPHKAITGQIPLGEDDTDEKDPLRPLSHKEFIAKRIKDEKLPTGFVDVGSSAYILRPEAIESVWYMYRITGDKMWQDKGWNMFKAIVRYTTTEAGNSAIDNVLTKDAVQLDEMESFWTAETLKYFYLLYSEPNVISLDNWVLNTEAHPFKRPKTSFGV
ncbi:glycoside hydrolase family 47 protein [Xylaria intraflava]|nr:glycoside hydrolase family 47 protein [Xylaria intraflava]